MSQHQKAAISKTPHGLLDRNDSYSLRGVCMIMIILHHTYLSAVYMPDCDTQEWLRLLGIGWSWGYLGTGVFLFLSGFGMYFSLLRNKPAGKAYIKSKATKLLTPYLWLWAISIGVYALCDTRQISPQLLTSFLSLDIPPDNEAWFYKVIICLYTLSIAAFNTFSNPRTCTAVVSVACVTYYCVANFIFHSNLWWFVTVLNFPFGMIVATFYDKLKNIFPLHILLPCTAAFALLSYLHPNPTILSLLFTTVTINIIRHVNINNRMLRYIGTNSILFYFLEEPAINYLSRFADSNFYSYSFSAVCITAILVFICRTTEKTLKKA